VHTIEAVVYCAESGVPTVVCQPSSMSAHRYDLKSTGKLQAVATDRVPDAYIHNAKLSDEIISLQKRLTKADSIAAKASSTWDTFRKERDFHRMHHKRVVQVRHCS
jgi:sperm-associated antigen 16 protein